MTTLTETPGQHGQTADLVLFAAAVHPFDNDGSGDPAEAIALTGDRIAAVGSRQEIESLIGPDTQVKDFGEASIIPGLTDSHVHPIWGLMEIARGIDLTDLNSIDAVIEALQKGERHGDEGWLLAWGADPNAFGTPMSTAALEQALPGVPIYIRLRDAHSALVSQYAIELAGITGNEQFPDKSRVEVTEDGSPTGVLLEINAMALMEKVLPERSFEDIVQAVDVQLNDMADKGLASAQVMDCDGPTLDIVRELELRGELPLRLRFSPMCMPGTSREHWQELADMQGVQGRRWMVEGIKFFIDGTIDNGTAWLSHPDCYGESIESVWNSPEEYAAAVRFFAERGIPTATHAIGDAGVGHALDAIASTGQDRSRAVHRIEHIETVPDDLVRRFAELDVIASMQPIHATRHTLADGSDNWSVRLGQKRASQGWRCLDLIEAGVPVALGSDWPVTPVDPRAMMADTQLRRPVDRPDWEPVQPSQRLTALQAHQGYTTASARAAGRDKVTGRIAPGFWADLTVLAADPLILSPEAQAVNPVRATVVAGALRTTTDAG